MHQAVAMTKYYWVTAGQNIVNDWIGGWTDIIFSNGILPYKYLRVLKVKLRVKLADAIFLIDKKQEGALETNK